MNNEIGRKITSLTLMTIMLAGGLTFAIPGVMPAAHAANANLFVSAENSQFDNYMSGPQVIEVVIIDSDINDTDEAKGEPDVTVNSKDLRMAQAVDGNWYGYFADRSQALIADSTSENDGIGLDFGTFCGTGNSLDVIGFSLTETVGFAIPLTNSTDPPVTTIGGNATGSDDGEGTILDCNNLMASTVNGTAMNVLREAKDLNTQFGNPNVDVGQIGFEASNTGSVNGLWPFIQLYNLNPTGNVVIQYNKGGGSQSTTLTFDTVDQFAGLSLDRAVYPQASQVHATITDLWLNIDPTDEDSWTFGTLSTNATAYYQLFDENGAVAGDGQFTAESGNVLAQAGALMCRDNCSLLLDTDAQNTGNAIVTLNNNADSDLLNSGTTDASTRTLNSTSLPVTITEQGVRTGVFGTYDESDTSVLQISETAPRGKSASLDYNKTPKTVLVGFDFASIDIELVDDKWNSGEEVPVVLVDGDMNKNSRVDEDLDVFNSEILVPTLATGDPFTLGASGSDLQILLRNTTNNAALTPLPSIGMTEKFDTAKTIANYTADVMVDDFSQRAIVNNYTSISGDRVPDNELFTRLIIIDLETTLEELRNGLLKETDSDSAANFINYDVRSTDAGARSVSIGLLNAKSTSNITGIMNATGNVLPMNVTSLVINGDAQGYVNIKDANDAIFNVASSLDASDQSIGLLIQFSSNVDLFDQADEVFVVDFFSFGFTDDGVQASERIANQIIRIEAEETGDNTSTFKGSLEYVMVNQLNIIDDDTFAGITPIADDPSFIVIEDLTDEDSPRVSYNDLGADGVVTPISAQEEAPSHSGVVSLNQDSYKIADTVVVTLEDLDLNVDSDLIDIYTVVDLGTSMDRDNDQIGMNVSEALNLSFGSQGRLLDVTFDDAKWTDEDACVPGNDNDGLAATGFTLVETDTSSGKFVGDFQIPSQWCRPGPGVADPETATGLDIEVNYVDYRDASGEIIEVGDSAGVRASTGSVSLDRTVYPVPFGTITDFTVNRSEDAASRSVFPVHESGTGDDGNILDANEALVSGDLMVHIRVNDPDFDVNPSGEDSINANNADLVNGEEFGPVKISVIRGSDTVILGYAGGPTEIPGLIGVGSGDEPGLRQLGPIDEIAPDAGIYEYDLTVKFTDGPASTNCPNNVIYDKLVDDRDNDAVGNAEERFNIASDTEDYCILQGDILQVEYTDPADASGDVNTVTDSATFDLRNGVLQTDKSVYIIGSDMILTLIEPDLDLDNDSAETYDLDLIEWDSDAATTTMGDLGLDSAAFDPEPTDLRETGDSTGIFQIVIEIPQEIGGPRNNLERGEEIILEYTDWGPSGSDYVGDEDEDVNLTIFTSNFGATVELDQKVYTWTDKVYITIVAPDHNFDGDLVDEIGDTSVDPIKVSTREGDIDNYKLVETGTDTGIFTGEVILTGFTSHDADGDGTESDASGITSGDNSGPTDGLLPADDDDGISVSFEFSENETVVGSALIRWNIGEVQWLEASYPASGTGVVRVIDPDMNLNPEAVDNFDVDVWSDSDAGGIDLTVTETNEATGIFEGTVFFTIVDDSAGHRLRVAEGDTVTARYEDNTLPDPYTTADELDITATSLIGTVVPPLERAVASNLRIVDAFGNSLDAVSADQQVQISADLANGQDRDQLFAYLVQVQDGNGVTVSLSWLLGDLKPGQSLSPAQSWLPNDAGTYKVTVFVWESVDNPTALSPPITTEVTVQ